MGNFNGLLKTFIMAGVITLSSLVVQGCTPKDYTSNAGNTLETVTPEMNKPVKKLDAGVSIDTSVSSGYYLSLGGLDEDIILDGKGHNKPGMEVVGKKIVFPQGEVKSISIWSWSRKEEAYNPPKSEIIQYINALENAVIVKDVPWNVLNKMVKIQTHMLHLNSNGEFQTINIIGFGNGYYEISVQKDDKKDFAKDVTIKMDSGKKYNHVFVHSIDAEKILKKWINWENQGKKGFKMIKSASLFVGENADIITLTQKQLKKLKKYLKSGKKTASAPCGYENYFECKQRDGSRFHFSISADGESISTDKGVYTVDYPDNVEIVRMLKKLIK